MKKLGKGYTDYLFISFTFFIFNFLLNVLENYFLDT